MPELMMNNNFTIEKLSPVKYRQSRSIDGIETVTNWEVRRYSINGEDFEISTNFILMIEDLTDDYKEAELISNFPKKHIEKLQRAKIVSETLYDFVEPHPDLLANIEVLNKVMYDN